MHKLLETLNFSHFLWKPEGDLWNLVWMAGWEEESEVSGEKRVDF